MPRMDGLELARAVRTRPALANTAIVLLTSSPTDNQVAEQAGVTHHLLKPPRQSDLYDAIAQAIAGQSPRSSSRPVNGESVPAFAGADADGPVVLVAEDNEVIQLLATTMIEQRGLKVELARNGREALEMSRARDYGAIFMDCQMPELDGYDVTARIRSTEDGRSTPIIAMTAHAMPGDRERCLAAGMNDYLSKPIQPDQLDRVLERWLPGHDHHGADEISPTEPAPLPRTGVAGPEALDREVVDGIRDALDASMRARLLDTFAESLHDCLERIQSALERDDRAELSRAAHLLKGGSATIGARALSQACHTLERLATSDRSELRREATALGALGQSTLDALRSRLLEPHD
jgi:CheY-like chemotaxis protein